MTIGLVDRPCCDQAGENPRRYAGWTHARPALFFAHGKRAARPGHVRDQLGKVERHVDTRVRPAEQLAEMTAGKIGTRITRDDD